MTRLLVRDPPPEVVVALKRQAARHGCSVEAEHREILKAALIGPTKKTFAQVLAAMPNVGEDADFQRIDDTRVGRAFT